MQLKGKSIKKNTKSFFEKKKKSLEKFIPRNQPLILLASRKIIKKYRNNKLKELTLKDYSLTEYNIKNYNNNFR